MRLSSYHDVGNNRRSSFPQIQCFADRSKILLLDVQVCKLKCVQCSTARGGHVGRVVQICNQISSHSKVVSITSYAINKIYTCKACTLDVTFNT